MGNCRKILHANFHNLSENLGKLPDTFFVAKIAHEETKSRIKRKNGHVYLFFIQEPGIGSVMRITDPDPPCHVINDPDLAKGSDQSE